MEKIKKFFDWLFNENGVYQILFPIALILHLLVLFSNGLEEHPLVAIYALCLIIWLKLGYLEYLIKKNNKN